MTELRRDPHHKTESETDRPHGSPGVGHSTGQRMNADRDRKRTDNDNQHSGDRSQQGGHEKQSGQINQGRKPA